MMSHTFSPTTTTQVLSGPGAKQQRSTPSSTRLATARRGACRPSARINDAAQQPSSSAQCTKRELLLGAASLALTAAAASPASAVAFKPAPPGFRRHVDKLDGYTFVYPDTWIPVTTSGNDVFYRNPYVLDENLFVDISSPSSSKFSSVSDLGTPEAAAERTRKQYLEEFMSTRLGVRREAEVASALQRTGEDGRQYYDLQVLVRSYASRNQLSVTQSEIDAGLELEWERRFLATLGVANRRLYQMRLQTSEAAYKKSSEALAGITSSFRCYDVEVL